MRFVVDDMLGKLARWLRIMGYDTVYATDRSDREVVAISRQENRTLLTRDRELADRLPGSLLVESNDPEEQLEEVVERLDLEVPGEPGKRCPSCNGELEGIEKEEWEEDIPTHTYEEQERFWRCRDCGKLYWPGSHWQRIEERLEELA